MEQESKFEQLQQEYKSILLAKHHYEHLKRKIAEEKEKLIYLEDIVEQEYEDIQLIEKGSMRSIFHKVLGDKNNKQELARQDYLHAVLEYKECKKVIDLLEYEQGVLEKKINKETNIRTAISQTFLKEKNTILKKYPLTGMRLLALMSQRHEVLNQKKELQVTKSIAVKVQDLLLKMIDSLNKSKHSGKWNKANSMNRVQKNSYIDQAQNLSYEVKQVLLELEDDLVHLSIKLPIQSEKLDIFKSFNDIYYSHLISDWIVHSQIVQSLDYVETIANDINNIIEKLVVAIGKCVQKENDLREQKSRLILNL